MAGFGYLLSAKTVAMVYESLGSLRDAVAGGYQVAFNRLEDTFLGHYLTSLDVKFVNISTVIDPYGRPNVDSLHHHILDHMYNTDVGGVLMLDKYKMHCKLHRMYLTDLEKQ